MSEVVEMTGAEHAERLLPLLKEYADKFQHILERVADVVAEMHRFDKAKESLAIEGARLICLVDTLTKPVTDLCRTASGLLQHAELDPTLWGELKLRLDETEECVRFSVVVVEGLVNGLDKKQLSILRSLVEKTGRNKAPF